MVFRRPARSPLRISLGNRILKGALVVMAGGLVAAAAFAGSVVRISTPVGNIDLELYDQQRPITVQNFLSYLKKGRYQNSFSHRLVPGFVIQGGGYFLQSNATSNTVTPIPTFAAIKNEFAVGPKLSNVKGTITMAKVAATDGQGNPIPGGGPDSATSQWFINLKDNNTGLADAGNLDLQNGGFTVFGRVIAGMEVLQIFNADFADSNTTVRGVFDASGKDALNNSDFANLPLLANTLDTGNLIYTTMTLLSEGLPTVHSHGKKLLARQSSLKISGTASAGVNVIEWQLGAAGKLRRQRGGTSWQFQVTGLKRRANLLYIRAVTILGTRGSFQKIKIVRK